MTKATISLPGGARVTIEGTANEVNVLVRRLAGGPQRQRFPKKPGPQELANTSGAARDLVLELRESDFFSKPRGLTEVKEALAAEGHIVPITTLSGVMLSAVKRKDLRRLRNDEDKNWKYVRR